MAGNNILQYMDEAALKATAIDASTYRWELETLESYEHRLPQLMTIEIVAGPGRPERWDGVARRDGEGRVPGAGPPAARTL
jgi:hypothetical protein